MIFTVLVHTQPAQGTPVELRDAAAKETASGRWRFTATTDDRNEALRWLELLRQECEADARVE